MPICCAAGEPCYDPIRNVAISSADDVELSNAPFNARARQTDEKMRTGMLLIIFASTWFAGRACHLQTSGTFGVAVIVTILCAVVFRRWKEREVIDSGQEQLRALVAVRPCVENGLRMWAEKAKCNAAAKEFMK